MAKFFVALFALVSIASVGATAQSPAQATPRAETSSIHRTAAKSILVSGRVSSVALKGREGSLVTVKCYVDAPHNQIQIVSVNRVQPEVR
jgi:hypothetical protein